MRAAGFQSNPTQANRRTDLRNPPAFSQNAHRSTYFHIKNYTPLCNPCQPFAQIPRTHFQFFVAIDRFQGFVLCTLTLFFGESCRFSMIFLSFAQSASFFHAAFTKPWHTKAGVFAIPPIFRLKSCAEFIHFPIVS